MKTAEALGLGCQDVRLAKHQACIFLILLLKQRERQQLHLEWGQELKVLGVPRMEHRFP